MHTINLFINPRTRLLRSGWRALAFIFIASLPQVLMSLLFRTSGGETTSIFEISLPMIMVYAVLCGWVVLVSWACLRFLDRLGLRALGMLPHSKWRSEVLLGFAISAAMIAVIAVVQFVAGGLKIEPNPVWWDGGVNTAGLALVTKDVLMSLALLTLAAAFEELAYRGYPFQTLLRGLPAVVPVILFSVYFGLAHWGNPSRTLFSTANTVLAGVWLAVAYLKTRSLWFPTALHFGWNWTMGAVFGLPVSGLLIPQHPILVSTAGEPLWLTGGDYGPEGGLAATAVVILSTALIWKAKWLTVAPEMELAWSQTPVPGDSPVRLDLRNEEG